MRRKPLGKKGINVSSLIIASVIVALGVAAFNSIAGEFTLQYGLDTNTSQLRSFETIQDAQRNVSEDVVEDIIQGKGEVTAGADILSADIQTASKAGKLIAQTPVNFVNIVLDTYTVLSAWGIDKNVRIALVSLVIVLIALGTLSFIAKKDV